MSNLKIVMIGGGSVKWTPHVATDLFLTEALRGSRLVLVDIDPHAAELLRRYCQMIADQVGTGWRVETDEIDSALDRADGVCVCISTGGYTAMQQDYSIPERFGIYHSVGDTVGPGGISRTLRNVPVFVDIARRMERRCPHTWMVHVTNPLAQLTRSVWKSSDIRCVGLCHNFLSTRAFLSNFFKCKPQEINATSVGVNHFTWMKDLTCRGQNVSDQLTLENYLAYEAAKRGRLVRSGTTDDAIAEATGEASVPRYLLNFELYERFGYFPVGAASHVAENFPHYLHSPETAARHQIYRKGVLPGRQAEADRLRELLIARVEGREALPEPEASLEPVAPVLAGLCTGLTTQTVVNLPNEGQITNLPMGTVVETWGVITRDRMTPVQSGAVPAPLRGMVSIIVDEEELAVDAALSGDRRKVVQALAVSPLVKDKDRAGELADALLTATARWLPQFQKPVAASPEIGTHRLFVPASDSIGV